MRTKWLVLLVFSGLAGSVARAQTVYSENFANKRILFLGNSITYAGHYVDFTVAILALEHTGANLEAINVGLPSETVSGLSEPGHADGRFPRPYLHDRLDRILEEVKPDLVFSCYGMNDGIYLPLSEDRFGRYRDGIRLLHEKVSEKSIPLIHFTPPVFDPRKDPAYATVLETYSNWLLTQRETSDWKVIDLHFPMKDYLLQQRAVNPDFVLAEDAVHPNQMGHWIMAKALVAGLGILTVAEKDTPDAYFGGKKNGQQVLSLVRESQAYTKDAWLSHIGHNRPGMKEAAPLKKALKIGKKSRNEIKKLTSD